MPRRVKSCHFNDILNLPDVSMRQLIPRFVNRTDTRTDTGIYATGEWKGAGKQPLQIMYGGVAVLILALMVLSRASDRFSMCQNRGSFAQ